MAGNTVLVRFLGEDSDLRRALRRLGDESNKAGNRAAAAGKAFALIGKPLAVLGAAGGAVQVLAGVAAAAQQLAPAVLLLPGALLTTAAAMGTFKLATAGFADALKPGAAGDKALAKLTGNARETALAVRELGKEFGPVKRAVQDAFFANFAGDVKNLGAQYLPVLSAKLPGIASQFNAMGRSLAAALSRPSSQNGIEKVLDNTTAMLKNMRDAVGNVVSGFLGLGAVGSTYMPRLGAAIDRVTLKFKAWVDKGVQSGRITQLIDGAIAGFKDLAAVADNVGSILGSVWKGLSAGSGATSPLSMLRDTTGALKDLFASAAMQGPLAALGQTMASLGSNLRDVLVAALRAAGPIVQALAPIVQALGDTIRNVLVAAFDKLGPPITRLIEKLAPILIPALQWVGDVIVNAVIPALAGFIDWLAGPGINQIKLFALQTIIGFTSVLSVALQVTSGMLNGFSFVFRALSFLPGSFGASMGRAADSTAAAARSVDGLRSTVDQVKSKSVDIAVETSRAMAGVIALQTEIRKINGRQVQIQLYTTGLGSGGLASAGRLAHGGPVVGPGSGTSDSVPAWLSNGEHVWTAAEVAAAGGQNAVAALRRAVMTGRPVTSGAPSLPVPAQGLPGGPQMGGGSGGGVAVSFTGNTSDALATVIMQLVRTGRIQLAGVR